MAKIYSAPKEPKLPDLNFGNIKGYHEACDKYLSDLKELLRKRNPTEHVGETIKFPVADGYAMYMVASIKPLELVHIQLWDAWHFDYANRLTAKDVKEKIAQEQSLWKLFESKSK
jgi:hypothetical protein